MSVVDGNLALQELHPSDSYEFLTIETPMLYLAAVDGVITDEYANLIAGEHTEGTVVTEPTAILAEMVPGDAETVRKATRFICRVALDDDFIDPGTDSAPNVTLQKTLDRARAGDLEARQSAKVNVRTAVVESMIKSGHMSHVEMTRNEKGNWLQYGAALLHVNANALRTKLNRGHPGLMDRAEAEAVNGHRVEEYSKAELLDDNYLIFPSLVPSEEEVPFKVADGEAGFFGDSMTISFQFVSTEDEVGSIDSAFVPGVAEKGGERFDIETMRTIYLLAGFDANDWQPLDFLANPLVMPKTLLPNGPSDFLEVYFAVAEELSGKVLNTEDLSTLAERSAERESGLDSLVEEVLDQLIEQSDGLDDVESSLELLVNLIHPLVVRHAVKDTSIDPGVFGPAAAPYIISARSCHEAGNLHEMKHALKQANNLAIVTGCGFTRSANEGEQNVNKNGTNIEADKDCDYISKVCPQCGEKNVKTHDTSKQISGDCGCIYDKINNKVVRVGNGKTKH